MDIQKIVASAPLSIATGMSIVRTDILTEIPLDWVIARLRKCPEEKLFDIKGWLNSHTNGSFRYSTKWKDCCSLLGELLTTGNAIFTGDDGGIFCGNNKGSSLGATHEQAIARRYALMYAGETVQIPSVFFSLCDVPKISSNGLQSVRAHRISLTRTRSV